MRANAATGGEKPGVETGDCVSSKPVETEGESVPLDERLGLLADIWRRDLEMEERGEGGRCCALRAKLTAGREKCPSPAHAASPSHQYWHQSQRSISSSHGKYRFLPYHLLLSGRNSSCFSNLMSCEACLCIVLMFFGLDQTHRFGKKQTLRAVDLRIVTNALGSNSSLLHKPPMSLISKWLNVSVRSY
jgi:hypothetical protein